ncbi:hypothetical protein F511_34575 [Dorcoceras hygrometricum]|uniref:Uncharacterized protein n=1 Tax=Dorcoceras hygrometricum TaxID=472368 RepID=A0A2Z7BGS9_9LAMI|nr:hypothetical protein F511_34575 [Dorcoceras hygrometricum]
MPVEVIAEIAGSKKRQATEGDAPVIPKKRRTVKSKASPSTTGMDIVAVAQDVVPIQVVDPTPAATVEPVKDTVEVYSMAPTDEVDVIIEQVIAETSKLGTDETEKEEQRFDETEIGEDFDKWLDESFVRVDAQLANLWRVGL